MQKRENVSEDKFRSLLQSAKDEQQKLRKDNDKTVKELVEGFKRDM